MKKLIYSVEDDANIAFIIKAALENSGYEVKSFSSAESFLEAFNNKKPDLILLDMMLPKVSGTELLKYIRSNSNNNDIDIIIVSANKLLTDKVDGLSLGADDYIEKPFEILELISRVNARFRKDKTHLYEAKDISLDENRHEVRKNGVLLELTNTEFDILYYLLKEKGNALSRDLLMEKLWGEAASYETRTIDMHIKNIRKKLGDSNIIQTVHGVGYKIND